MLAVFSKTVVLRTKVPF